MDVDKESPEYLAGRRDLANELAEEANKPLTLDDIRAMSSDEINRNSDRVQTTLGGNS